MAIASNRSITDNGPRTHSSFELSMRGILLVIGFLLAIVFLFVTRGRLPFEPYDWVGFEGGGGCADNLLASVSESICTYLRIGTKDVNA